MSDTPPIRNQLLRQLQQAVPLTPRPYAALAVELGCDERDVLDATAALRGGEQPIVREIAGIFESTSLGYASALVGCAAPEAALDQAGATVAAHPGVSHCYAREGPLNLWYTLTLGPDSRLGVDASAARLAGMIGATVSHVLPTLTRYKIGVQFDAGGGLITPRKAGANAPPPPRELSDDEKAAVAALQTDLPNEPEPFEPLARQVGLSVERLLGIAAGMKDARLLRRYGALLHHRRAGATANVMVAWRIDPAAADALGPAAAASDAVSHCYLRPSAPDWPYNLYTMIHGRNEEDCAMAIDQLIATTGLGEHVRLPTRREYKKARVKYFADGVAQWEREHG